MRALLLCFVVALSGCSFTTAGNFTECKTDLDCGNATACVRGYCLPLPAGCKRDEAGGTKNAFTSTNRIPLVALLPITTESGTTDDSEMQSANAMKLAISEANERLTEARGLFGLFVCDTDAPDGGDLQLQATWFIENLRAPIFLVSSSSPTNNVAQNVARVDAGTLIISPNATSPELGTRHRIEGNVWRVAPPDTGQAKVLADLMKLDFPDAGQADASVKISILHTTSIYGTGFAIPLQEELAARGFSPTLYAFVSNDDVERLRALRRSADSTPAATVIIGNTVHAVEFVKTSRASLPALTRDAGHRWYLTDGLKEPGLITPDTQAELERAVGTAPAQGAGVGYSVFRDQFLLRYGRDPDTTNYTSHSYDATWLVMLATQYALGNGTPLGEVTGPRVGEGMTRFALSSGPSIPLRADKWTELSDSLARGTATNVEGASGPLNFDVDAGASGAPYEIWQVVDGGIRVVRQVWP